ncbi:MAG: hypothetical protein UU64_C0019G0004 [candidate division WWE3 bacterium GW2011_GWF2_41_45]|uniref:Uncharacterized protein n=3 Tax=Katanobacteria TaxID=422282 RepID=A0A1F4W2R7_UNCKA|nr:MAG: hypothetical protein UU55_C0005G0066 [candidate division WWE3 bacterium GW2011_GWC2_41_23]KKS08919.1 MAG: hypothetical protein UU64_C0019G0004 [candidate division WWE3 bacterium GW2011_GWF2_41_45]KKS11823.1 MAG: hypothetical protein UU68_C0010G0004 [candidate division WWE3 bacterium GW2011_GWF1_41_53]KKS19517.1 MAG: hypothetical protein UU79_C0017G0020 [candidate division WWE3 bacterium GW2011_GWE1_41_72]KKS25922.1 MAG: hypothetical protein UU86_C0046G0014 [candidate division WWE3 bacte
MSGYFLYVTWLIFTGLVLELLLLSSVMLPSVAASAAFFLSEHLKSAPLVPELTDEEWEYLLWEYEKEKFPSGKKSTSMDKPERGKPPEEKRKEKEFEPIDTDSLSFLH